MGHEVTRAWACETGILDPPGGFGSSLETPTHPGAPPGREQRVGRAHQRAKPYPPLSSLATLPFSRVTSLMKRCGPKS